MDEQECLLRRLNICATSGVVLHVSAPLEPCYCAEMEQAARLGVGEVWSDLNWRRARAVAQRQTLQRTAELRHKLDELGAGEL